MVNTSGPKILLVEDDSRMSGSLRDLLRTYGYHAQTSKNLHSALDRISSTVYDLILLDLRIKDQSGLKVLDYLEKNEIDTRVIVITGEQSEKKAITAFKKGAFDYLKKPFEPDELIESTKKAIASINQQRKNKRIQNTIISSRERYRSIVDRQKDYVLLLDKDYKISFINKTYATYLGSEPKKLIGRSYKTLVQESTHNLLFGSLDDVITSSAAMIVEFQILDSNGRNHHWQEWDFSGIFNDKGQLCEIQCIGRNVTQKKLRTDKVEKKKERFRKLAELTSDWLWEIDNNNVYTYVNPVVFGILGYQPEEVLGKSPFDFMPANEAKRIKRILQKLKAEGRPLKNIENINLHKNGSKVTLETSGVPIFDQSGAVVGYRGIDRNITIRKMVEENLSKQSTRGNIMSVKSRRGSNRLVSICASCKMIRDDNNNWNRIEDYFEARFNIMFSHGICPGCAKQWYPEVFGSDES